jgi:peptide/nickel transport system permease protein
VTVCLIAIFSPLIVPNLDMVYDGDLISRLKPPSAEFWFGTDSLGRDVFARVIMGTRGALEVALTVVALAIAIGVPAGLYAGYSDGWGSQLVMRLTDVFLAVPQLILALAVAQLMGRGLESAMAALALTYWPFFCRTVYGEVRRLRSALFIEAQQGLGASTSRILFVHLLPNVASAVIVRATIGMGFTIMTTAVLGFLGIGATPPNPDWGLAIAEGREYLPQSWWGVTFPGLGILFTVLGFNLFGDGLRDLVDPKLRRSR